MHFIFNAEHATVISITYSNYIAISAYLLQLKHGQTANRKMLIKNIEYRCRYRCIENIDVGKILKQAKGNKQLICLL